MALVTISGEPASLWEEVAHGVAQRLGFELVTETRLLAWMTQEFGDAPIPDRAWRAAVVSILARMAAEHHLVVALAGGEFLFEEASVLSGTPGLAPEMILRAGIAAPERRRAGNLM